MSVITALSCVIGWLGGWAIGCFFEGETRHGIAMTVAMVALIAIDVLIINKVIQ